MTISFKNKTTAAVCISRRALKGRKYLFRDIHNFYPTALNGCWGIVFGIVSGWSGGRAGGQAAGNSLSGLYLRNRKV